MRVDRRKIHRHAKLEPAGGGECSQAAANWELAGSYPLDSREARKQTKTFSGKIDPLAGVQNHSHASSIRYRHDSQSIHYAPETFPMQNNALQIFLAGGFLVACSLTGSPVSTAQDGPATAQDGPATAQDGPATAQDGPAKASTLKVLLVAGGCCHDYSTQTKLLKEGIESRINADVTVMLSSDTSTKAKFEIYESDDWAKGFDVILHDECSANVTERPYVDRILAAHRAGTPAVNLHCAMHSYRWGKFREPVELGAENAGWYEMIGVQSTAHGPKTPIHVIYTDTDHPITKGLEDWTTIDEELYNNVRVFAGSGALVSGTQMTPPNKKELKQNPDAPVKEAKAVVAWTNEYGPQKTKIFSTSLGHQNETVADARYMDLVVRGILWVTGNITPDGNPKPEYANSFTIGG